jgi:hypothetical protein
MMTEQEIKGHLGRLLWDTPATAEDAYALLMEDKECKALSKHNLYQKILNTYRWYRIKEIIPPEKMDYAFSDDVLNGLFPKGVRETYRYAKRFLHA